MPNELQFPSKNGWYWVLINGDDAPTPCWFGDDYKDNDDEKCFLPGGMGDSSSTGLYKDDISEIGEEIVVPT